MGLDSLCAELAKLASLIPYMGCCRYPWAWLDGPPWAWLDGLRK